MTNALARGLMENHFHDMDDEAKEWHSKAMEHSELSNKHLSKAARKDIPQSKMTHHFHMADGHEKVAAAYRVLAGVCHAHNPERAVPSPGTLTGEESSLQESASEFLLAMIREFANGLNDDDNIFESFREFCEYCDLSPEDSETLGDIITEAANSIDDEENANDAVSFPDEAGDDLEKKLKAFLRLLKTTPSPFKGILSNLRVGDRADPYGNKWGAGVKNFDRKANRYGHPPEEEQEQEQDDLQAGKNHGFPNEFDAIARSRRQGRTGEYQLRREHSFALPTTSLQEGLSRELNPAYIKSVDQLAGKLAKADASTVNPARDWKENQKLVESHKHQNDGCAKYEASQKTGLR